MSNRDRQLTPQAALDEAHRVTRRVRAAARWHGWVWLVLAVLTPVFWIGTREEGILSRPQQFWIAVGFAGLGAVLTVWEQRRGVVGHQTARLDRPMTAAYVVAMVVVAAVTMVWDPGVTPWYVAVALLPSAPCLVAAWRLLRG